MPSVESGVVVCREETVVEAWVWAMGCEVEFFWYRNITKRGPSKREKVQD